MNDVSLRLRHYSSGVYPMAPTVLKVIIKYSNRDIVPLLDDTIQEVGAIDSCLQCRCIMGYRVRGWVWPSNEVKCDNRMPQ